MAKPTEGTLFDHALRAQLEKDAPLAHRLRPRSLDEFVGQEHIVGPGRLLRRAIQADQLSSLIVYGPPGTGKTTLASVIARHTKSHFVTINAVLAGVKEIREAVDAALDRRGRHQMRTTLFVDEVHRWNKAQQDALLPHVENGTIILIGATTENPYFEVNKALVSRSRLFQMVPLNPDHLRKVAERALSDPELGYGKRTVQIDTDALDHMVNTANGDARGVLNALELAVETTPPDAEGVIRIDLSVAEESIQRRAVLYDKDGDVHYDTISAFIKSMRGSDPDATLYWMARMVYAGEDARFIFRRMAILASEDVGLADPQAVGVVEQCWSLFERVGMPEGRFHLAQAALYLATCAKSNTTMSFFDALASVEKEGASDVPVPLKDASRDGEGFGHGAGYLYPHAFRDHWVAQQYLPESLMGRLFYEPSDSGYERGIQETVRQRREIQLATMLEAAASGRAEVLTTGAPNKRVSAWLERTMASTGRALESIRDALFIAARIERHHVVLVVAETTGLLTWESLRRAPEGFVVVHTEDPGVALMIEDRASHLPPPERPRVLTGPLSEVPAQLSGLEGGILKFDRIVAHNVFTQTGDGSAFAALARDQLQSAGHGVITQVVPRHGQRLHDLVDFSQNGELKDRVRPKEDSLYQAPDDPLTRWDGADFIRSLSLPDLTVSPTTTVVSSPRLITAGQLDLWLAVKPRPDGRPSYSAGLLARGLSLADLETLAGLYRQQLSGRTVNWNATVVVASLKPFPC